MALKKLNPQKTIKIFQSRQFVELTQLFEKYNYTIKIVLTDIPGDDSCLAKDAGYHIAHVIDISCKKNNFEIINYLLKNKMCKKSTVYAFAKMQCSYTILSSQLGQD